MTATFTNAQKLDAVLRELRYRSRVYERQVGLGKMSRAKADFEEAIFRSIAEDYRTRVALEEAPDLLRGAEPRVRPQ